MTGSQVIKPLHVTFVAKMALLALIASLFVSPCLPSFAQALESTSVTSSAEISENTTSSESSISEDTVPLAVLEFTASSPLFENRAKDLSYDSEISVTAEQTQNTSEQESYVSVRGYSAFNHFSVALTATVAAIAVIAVGVLGMYAYRRHKGHQGVVQPKSKTHASVLTCDDPDFVEERD